MELRGNSRTTAASDEGQGCETVPMADEQLDAQREKFKAALEAKKNKGQHGSQTKGGATNAGKDSSKGAVAKREHRRKSG